MAAAGSYLTYDANKKQLKEDLLDFITDLSPKKTPLFTGLAKTSANSVFHEFLEDSRSRGGANAQVEGADYTFSQLSSPSRNLNYTQIVSKPYRVSKTTIASETVAGSELKRQRVIAMEEWKLDMEQTLIFGSGNSGASNTARVMKGILTAISTNATNTSNSSLTESFFNDLLQMGWENAESDTYEAYFDIRLKRVVSGFTAGNTRNVEADDKRLFSNVDIYESDVAMVKLFAHHDLSNSNRFFAIQPRAFKIAMLRNITDEMVPSLGSYESGVVEGEGTLEFLYEKAGVDAQQIV
jgi:hypothetical protein